MSGFAFAFTARLTGRFLTSAANVPKTKLNNRSDAAIAVNALFFIKNLSGAKFKQTSILKMMYEPPMVGWMACSDKQSAIGNISNKQEEISSKCSYCLLFIAECLLLSSL